jgi:hypothetical protein
MTPDSPELRPTPLHSRREATVQVLCDEFAKDHLSLAEFERRLDVAHRATALAELDALTADLRAAAPAAAAPSAVVPPRSAAPSEIPAQQTLVAVMGGVERRGPWVPARQTQVFALMGGAELDFREARLGAGVTEITIVCVMGGVEIVVPPGLIVDAGGIAVMGGFESMAPTPVPPNSSAPVLKVNGFVMMGGVEVMERERGETAREARKRHRRNRKNRGRGGSG